MPTRLSEIHIEYESAHVRIVTCSLPLARRIADLEGVERVVRLFADKWSVTLDKRYNPADVEREIAAASSTIPAERDRHSQ